MLAVDIEIVGPTSSLTQRARVDTGLDGGLILPLPIAKRIGAVLVKPTHSVVTADGRPLAGYATVVRVRIPKAGVEAETFAFCPRSRRVELLVGAFFLAQVGATMTLGHLTLRFPRPARHGDRRSSRRDTLDIGRWVVPVRPSGRWW